MKLLGIDPGFDRIGWAVANYSTSTDFELVAAGCIQTKQTTQLFERYLQLTKQLQQILAIHQPAQAVLESVFFSINKKTAMKVSEARGVIIATLLTQNVPIFEYTPNQIKLAVTGDGNADKKAVEKMIGLQLKLTTDALIDDTIDAIAIAFTHSLMKYKL
ncbi:MAG: crossover junction endodeoxyribonuclease RuvC [Candidatus Pacebacteria bacterium CG_4_10_14_0_8_um_filter_43_12]|nr:MAG: crossover junction endodeoxyribonuclease RuvC [Candidatus Pacebacteria bacterium CG10_big_fil_rev_8_21_14_0_10_44_11]PIY79938.1 MAG: crossover junction endodeoxyribonuclease RuvC [Candidatus Pacebacteria bacterium CG_4_10_14_0_8_um_filter_43_12]